MNKTIKQWFEMLPQPYREQALKNWEEQGAAETTTHSLSEALRWGFTWSNTQEGNKYWHSLSLLSEG